MKASNMCPKCDSIIVFNLKTTNNRAALLNHYNSSHCRKRLLIDNSVKNEQTIRFVQNLTNHQSNDDYNYEGTEPIYEDPSIQHVFAFNSISNH